MDSFEAHRPLMFSIAYRMLGSASEAEDILQEAYLRYQKVAEDSVQSPRAFLSTVVTRLCLNQLASARMQRETYIGPWLPEPLHTSELPEAELTARESISIAFLILLETLTPVERAAFLLREVFDYEYEEIARIVARDPATCRQLVSRAKRHIVDHRPRFAAHPAEHQELLNRFLEAVGEGRLDGLMTLLADDVQMWADGGGKTRGAATKPLRGREGVAQFVLASTRLPDVPYRAEITELNGEAAIMLRSHNGLTLAALFISVHSGQITEIRVIGNPDKLRRL